MQQNTKFYVIFIYDSQIAALSLSPALFFLQLTSRMPRFDKHLCIKMAAKSKEQQLLAVLSDLPTDIYENFIAEEVSLKRNNKVFNITTRTISKE